MINKIEKLQQEPSEDPSKEDLGLLEYQLQEIEDELTWQYDTRQIDKLKNKKKELEQKIQGTENSNEL